MFGKRILWQTPAPRLFLLALLLNALVGVPLVHSSDQQGTCVDKDDCQNEASSCPDNLVQPTDIHFMVINMDRSTERLAKMKELFNEFHLGDFERTAGVEIDPTRTYEIKKRSPTIADGDYGCALAHYRAWKKIAEGEHEWVIVLEDDVAPTAAMEEHVTNMPLVPSDATLMFLTPHSMSSRSMTPICDATSVKSVTWGRGMMAYLVNRAGAKRLADQAPRAPLIPVDGYIWKFDNLYVTHEDYFIHPCRHPCDKSVRKAINGIPGAVPQ